MEVHSLSGSYHSGELADEQATQFLLLTGSRAMTGDLTIQHASYPGVYFNTATKTMVLYHQDDNILRLMDAKGNVFRNLAVGDMYVSGNLKHTSTSNLRADASVWFNFQSYDSGLDQWVTNARQHLTPAYGFEIPRAGDISLLDDKFLSLGNTGSLPTPTGSLQGSLIIKTGSSAVADQLVACLWTGSNWAWVALQTGSVVT